MKFILYLVFISLPLVPVFGQSTYTLSECIDEALKNAYTIREQQIDNQLNTLKLNVNASKYRPQINANLTYINYPWDFPVYFFPAEEGSILSGEAANGTYRVGLGLTHNYSLGIYLQQTVFDADFFMAKKSSELTAKTNELLTKQAEEEVIYSVTKVFLEIMRVMEKEKMINDNQHRVEDALKIVRIRVENEMAYETDAEELELQKRVVETKKAMAVSGIEKQLDYLKFLMGKEVGEDVAIKSDTINFTVALNDSIFQQQGYNSQLIEQDIKAGEIQALAIKNQKLPELKAFANLMAMSQAEVFSPFSAEQYWYNPSTVGLTFQIPIMHGTRYNKEMRYQQMENEKKMLRKQMNDQYFKMAIENAKSDLELKQLELEEKRLNLELRKKVHRRKMDMFGNELIGISEVMETTSAITVAGNEYADTYFDYLLVQLEILKTTGMLKNILLN